MFATRNPGGDASWKGTRGNTAATTAYICWKKHGIYLSCGINSDYTLEQYFGEKPKINILLARHIRNRKWRPLRLFLITVLRDMITVLCDKNMSQKHKCYIIPSRRKTACKPWVVLHSPYINKRTPSRAHPWVEQYPNVILLSDLDFVSVDNEHKFMMRWHQARVNRRDGSIIISIAQKCISYGLVCGLVYN